MSRNRRSWEWDIEGFGVLVHRVARAVHEIILDLPHVLHLLWPTGPVDRVSRCEEISYWLARLRNRTGYKDDQPSVPHGVTCGLYLAMDLTKRPF